MVEFDPVPREGVEQEQEATFLALHHLAPSLPADLLGSLERALSARRLLPDRRDYTGAHHTLSYEQLRSGKFAHVPQDHLVRVASTLRDSVAASPSAPTEFAGLRTLLGRGCFDLTRFRARDVAHGRQVLPTVNIARKRPLAAKLLGRETGQVHARGAAAFTRFVPPELVCSSIRPQRTVRGHLDTVYCCVYNKSGSLLITGADDSVVKIWSAPTGLLLATCLGHAGFITFLAVSCDDQFVASGDMAGGVRVWHLQGGGRGDLGAPVCVLHGHDTQISVVSFHPFLPGALLSSSLDGTMRLWDIHSPQNPPIVLANMGPLFGVGNRNLRTLGALGAGVGAPVDPTDGGRMTRQQQQHLQQLGQPPPGGPPRVQGDEAENANRFEIPACKFDGSGRYIFAAGSDGGVYVWHWDFPSAETERAAAPFRDSRAPHDSPATVEDAAAEPQGPADDVAPSIDMAAEPAGPSQPAPRTRPLARFPVPQEVCRLPAHMKEVTYLALSRCGSLLATGGVDGQIKVWRAGKRKGIAGGKRWEEFAAFQLPQTELPDAMPGKPKKKVPEHPSINVISWSADDRHLVVTAGDNLVRVFDVRQRTLVHAMPGHERPVHVVECHPHDPRLAMTAGYDGYVVFWDIIRGKVVDVIDTVRFQPGGGIDGIPLVDALFAPDGSGLACSDVAGQLWIMGTGACTNYAVSQYDQFFHREQRELLRDAHGNVADAETGLAPACRRGFDALCDFNLVPYDEPYQGEYGRGMLLAQRMRRDRPLAAQSRIARAARALPPPPTSAIWDLPPCFKAATWVAAALNNSHDDRTAERFGSIAMQRLYAASLLHQPTTALEQSAVLVGRPDIMMAVAARLSEYAGPAGVMVRGLAGQLQPQPGVFETLLQGRSRLLDMDPETGAGRVRPTERALGIARGGRGRAEPPRGRGRLATAQLRDRPEDREEGPEVVVESDFDNSRDEDFAASESEGAGSDGLSDLDSSDYSGAEEPEPTRRSARMAAKRGSKGPKRRKKQKKRYNFRKRGRGEDGQPLAVDDSAEDEEESEEEESEEEEGGHWGIPPSEDEGEGEDGPRGRLRPRHNPSLPRSPRRRKQPSGKLKRKSGGVSKRPRATKADSRRYRFRAQPRALKAYGWLQMQFPLPGLYLPQAGDEVVYIAEGHLEFLTSDKGKKYREIEPLPWAALCTNVIGLGAAAMANLEALEKMLASEDEGAGGGGGPNPGLDTDEEDAGQGGRAQGAGPGPSSGVPSAAGFLRPFERCRVRGVTYRTVQVTHRPTAAVLTLELLDGNLAGASFELVLPPPFSGHAEFVVLQKEFARGQALQLTEGDRVFTVIYDEQLQAEGQCSPDLAQIYHGTVLKYRRDGNLWNCCYVAWDDEPADVREDRGAQLEGRLYSYGLRGGTAKGGVESTSEDKQWQSPWEIWKHEQPEEDAAEAEAGPSTGRVRPRLAQEAEGASHLVDPSPASDEDTRMLHGPILEAIQRAQAARDNHIFKEVPEPAAYFERRDTDGRVEGMIDTAYNVVVPLPVSLSLIEARVTNGYYRSVTACLADLELLAANARDFNGPHHKVSRAAGAIVAAVRRAVGGERLPPTRNTRNNPGPARHDTTSPQPPQPPQRSTAFRMSRRLGGLHDEGAGLPAPPPAPFAPGSPLLPPGVGVVPLPGQAPAAGAGAGAGVPHSGQQYRIKFRMGHLMEGAARVGAPEEGGAGANGSLFPVPAAAPVAALHALEDEGERGPAAGPVSRGRALATMDSEDEGGAHGGFQPPKRGRGRPRKYPAPDYAEFEEEEEALVEERPARRGKKRAPPATSRRPVGRPHAQRKNEDYVSGSDLDSEEPDVGSDEDFDVTDDSDSGSDGRRKRGDRKNGRRMPAMSTRRGGGRRGGAQEPELPTRRATRGLTKVNYRELAMDEED